MNTADFVCGSRASGWSRVQLLSAPHDTWSTAFISSLATRSMFAYLIEVDHDVALGAHAAHHVLQSQGVVDPRRVWHVQVVGFILVPLLHGCHHAVFICADHMQVLTEREQQCGDYQDTSFNCTSDLFFNILFYPVFFFFVFVCTLCVTLLLCCSGMKSYFMRYCMFIY